MLAAMLGRACGVRRARWPLAAIVSSFSIAVLAPGVAHAASNALRTSINVEAGTNQNSYGSGDTGNVQSPSPLTLTYDPTSSFLTGSGAVSTASAYTSVTSGYGLLQINAYGSANGVGGQGAGSEFRPYIGGGTVGYFQDVLTVGSNSLAVGTPVSLTFDLQFSGAASFVNSSNGCACDYSSASISTQFQESDARTSDSSANFSIVEGAGTFGVNQVVDVEVGDQLTIQGFLFASGHADSGNADGFSSFSVQGNSTLGVSNVSPGVTLQAESGGNYLVSTVPEPATWALLMVAGLAGIAGRRWPMPALRQARVNPALMSRHGARCEMPWSSSVIPSRWLIRGPSRNSTFKPKGPRRSALSR